MSQRLDEYLSPVANGGDLIRERPWQGSGLLMTLHYPSLLERLLAKVREGGAEVLPVNDVVLTPSRVMATLQVSQDCSLIR